MYLIPTLQPTSVCTDAWPPCFPVPLPFKLLLPNSVVWVASLVMPLTFTTALLCTFKPHIWDCSVSTSFSLTTLRMRSTHSNNVAANCTTLFLILVLYIIKLCIYMSQLLNVSICSWAFALFPVLLYCPKYCDEHRCFSVLLN